MKKVTVVVPWRALQPTGKLSVDEIFVEEKFEAKGDNLVVFTDQQGQLVIHDVTNTPPTEKKVIINTLATFKEWIYWKQIE